MDKIHVPVLLEEVNRILDLKKGDSYIDCTFGAGGHAEESWKRVGVEGRILGLERDKELMSQIVPGWKNRKNVKIVNRCFSDLAKVVEEEKFGRADGVLLDLGVSSWQLDKSERGFSFARSAPLDMRMGIGGLTAADFLNTADQEEMKEVFFKYSEIRNCQNIVDAIIKNRQIKEIETVDDLLKCLSELKIKKNSSRNLLARIWQSIRMRVNNEIDELLSVLPQAVEVLKPGGRLVVISFHSGEDRIVKDFFNKMSCGCVCPPDFPKCVCETMPVLKILTKKAMGPTKKELSINSRSSSAKLRAVMKI